MKVASDNSLLVVAHLLLSNSLLKFLDLVKSTDKVLLVVPFDVVCNRLHIVVHVVHFATVQLVLNVVGQLLVVVLGCVEVTGAFSFHEGAVELGLVLEHLGVSLTC